MHAMPHLAQSGTGGHSGGGGHHQSNSKPVKVKRTRQRVDAGEPRNSYASIANFSSRGGYHGYSSSGGGGGSHKFGSSSHNSNSSNSSSHHSSTGSVGAGAGGHSQSHHHHHHQALGLAGQANQAVNAAPPLPHHHPTGGSHHSHEAMFNSKQFSAFNAAAMAAAAAASATRPDMGGVLDPALLQMYQAALLNGYSQQQQAKAPVPVAEQFNLNSANAAAFCNANAFLNQLQSDASMASLMNNFNMESAAAAALLGSANSADAQLLRDILEAGGRAAEKNSLPPMGKQQHHGHHHHHQQELSPKSKSRAVSASKLFADLEALEPLDVDLDFGDACYTKESADLDRDFSLAATPGEEGAATQPNSNELFGQYQGNDTCQVKGKGKEGDLEDQEEDAPDEDEGEEAKSISSRRTTVGSSSRGGSSGREESASVHSEMASEEVAKTAAARDGNSTKEERRGRARPSPLSLRRAKSPTACSSGTGSTSSSGTTCAPSLGEAATSSSSVTGKIATSADVRERESDHHRSSQQTTNACSSATQLARNDNTDDSLLEALDQRGAVAHEEENLATAAADDEEANGDNSEQHQQLESSAAPPRQPSNQQHQSSAKRARVENIVSNMLLVTSSNGATTGATAPSSPTNPLALSPMKSAASSAGYSDGDETVENNSKPLITGVNGCKKRKLYQPQQQSSKLQNGGSLDIEDDDDIEDEEMVPAPEVELGVEAELDEQSFDGEEQRDVIDRSRRQQRASPPVADLPNNKEMDHNNLTPPPPTQPQPRTHTPRSEHLPTKRARLSDYEREYKFQLQSQLYSMQAKIAMQQLYAQQAAQQQSKAAAVAAAAVNGGGSNGSSQYARASPVNLVPDCDNSVNIDEKERSTMKMRSASGKFYDVEALVESLKGQILNSIGHIIDTTFRTHLEANGGRLALESGVNSNRTSEGRGNELLAQMLDAKYSRSGQKSGSTGAISLNNGTKSLGRDGSSPFALPSEASPAPKSFAYPSGQQQSSSGFYSKQPFYAMANMTPANLAAAYSNGAPNGGLMNGGTPASGPYSRDNASPILPEQSEALSLVVAPKKRRNKVTDSRLTPRTGNRIAREDGRASSVSPPLAPMHAAFSTASLGGVPVSLAGLTGHPTDFFDPSATSFPFADQTRLSSLFASNGDDAADLKNSLANGVNGVSASSVVSNPSVVSAVAQAAAAHHLQMLAASRASPDSLSGYHGSLMTSFGRGSGTGSENGGDGSETNDTTSLYDPTMPMTSTLSPMHLRKAKLMFFYVRYPSSSVLKMFFPDIKFNKNNTAQLVKWFSNFREFYYIQMEKYARQALSEGIKCAEDLAVTDDCELLRVLNLHYNRSNHIPIPDNFRSVCETTLREFFRALQQNKDTEQSWKKAIYKVIARLDDNVPDYFKNPNFMEQLE